MNQDHFLKFLAQDETARNLAAASVSLDLHGSNGYDLEKILYDTYSDRFSDQARVHQLIQDSKEDILSLTQEGLTNLGSYLGEYSLEDREMTPILLGQALSGLSEHAISYDLEQRLIGILRSVYGPLFNKDPEKTLGDLETKMEDSPDKLREIYGKVYDHYQEVLELAEELRNG